jgi:hypothetical protein
MDVVINYRKDDFNKEPDTLEVNNLVTIEYLKNWLLKMSIDIEHLKKIVKYDVMNCNELSDSLKNELIEKSLNSVSFLGNFLDFYLEYGIVILLNKNSLPSFSMSKIFKLL